MSTPLPQQEKRYTTPEEVQALIDQAMRNFRYPTKVAGGFLQSQNFVSGTAGWRLSPDGTIEGWKLITGGTRIAISANDDIQTAINALPSVGGTVELGAGTFNVSSHITVPDNVNLVGQGGSTIVDFGGNSAQFQFVGTLVYNTGTVAINTDSTTVTGSGTTFTSAMVGEYILISEFWYEITGFTSATSITIGTPFSSTNVSGASYVIATIRTGCSISNMVIQNSSTALIKIQYADGVGMDSLVLDDATVGVDDDDSSGTQFLNGFVLNCGTGMTFNNSQFGTFDNTSMVNITSGGALVFNTCANWAAATFGFANVVGNAISLTNVTNTGFENWAVHNVTGIGVNFVSGNSDVAFVDGSSRYCSSDGIRFSATSDYCSVTATVLSNNSGYGINIAAATCDNNTIHGNAFHTNTSGNITDSGTGTVISGNSPNSINTAYQLPDATLTALAAYNTNGLITQTATDTFTGRTLTGPAAGITVSNGNGVSGNPTLALANDLSAVEGLASTGMAARTGTDTWAVRTITGTTNRVTVTNGSGAAGNPTLDVGSSVYTVGGTDVSVSDGGSGRSSATAYAVICGGTTSTAAHQSIASVGNSGEVLTSNGAGALPTFQALTVGTKVSTVVSDTTVSGTATETTFATATITGGTLGTANAVAGMIYFSNTKASTSNTIIRMKYGSTTVVTITMDSNSTTSRTYEGHIHFMLMGAGTTSSQEGSCSLYSSLGNGDSRYQAADTDTSYQLGAGFGSAAETSTGDLSLTFTVEQNSADSFTKRHHLFYEVV